MNGRNNQSVICTTSREKTPFSNLVRFVFLETSEVLGRSSWWQNNPHFHHHPSPPRIWAVFGKGTPLKSSLRFAQKEQRYFKIIVRPIKKKTYFKNTDCFQSYYQPLVRKVFLFVLPHGSMILSLEHCLIAGSISFGNISNFEKWIFRKWDFCNTSKITTRSLKAARPPPSYGKWR